MGFYVSLKKVENGEKFLDSILIELLGFDDSRKSIHYYTLYHKLARPCAIYAMSILELLYLIVWGCWRKMSYLDLYKKRLNRYGLDFQSRLQDSGKKSLGALSIEECL